jgi:hypothetical protein
VPDPELAPELESAGFSREEFEQERDPELELEQDSELELNLELERDLEPDWGA